MSKIPNISIENCNINIDASNKTFNNINDSFNTNMSNQFGPSNGRVQNKGLIDGTANLAIDALVEITGAVFGVGQLLLGGKKEKKNPKVNDTLKLMDGFFNAPNKNLSQNQPLPKSIQGRTIDAQ